MAARARITAYMSEDCEGTVEMNGEFNELAALLVVIAISISRKFKIEPRRLKRLVNHMLKIAMTKEFREGIKEEAESTQWGHQA